MRTLFFVLALASALVAETRPATACSCMRPGSDEDETKKADAVFEGTVTNVWRPTAEPRSLAQLAVSVAVKGVRAGTTVTIDAGIGGGACGYHFERGKRYKVFAYKDDHGVLHTSICTATRQL